MQQYETLFVLHPEVPEAQVRETIERAKRLLEGMGGSVGQVHEWGLRDLAYPIQKQRRGYYVVIEYGAGGEAVRELERTLKIADEVMRFVSVRAAEVKRKESTGRKKAARAVSAPSEPEETTVVPE
ncbi:MAG: 30S ribosomal protein S6 [Deltaproteobacteria bacterium]|nr:30S ribosomal protein S6 [Deltaproteobacteria bacterium]